MGPDIHILIFSSCDSVDINWYCSYFRL